MVGVEGEEGLTLLRPAFTSHLTAEASEISEGSGFPFAGIGDRLELRLSDPFEARLLFVDLFESLGEVLVLKAGEEALLSGNLVSALVELDLVGKE